MCAVKNDSLGACQVLIEFGALIKAAELEVMLQMCDKNAGKPNNAEIRELLLRHYHSPEDRRATQS